MDMEGADSEGDGTPIFDDGDGCAAAPAATATSQSPQPLSFNPRRRTRSLSPTLAAGLPLLKSPSVVWKMMPQCTLEVLHQLLKGWNHNDNPDEAVRTLARFFGNALDAYKPACKASTAVCYMEIIKLMSCCSH